MKNADIVAKLIAIKQRVSEAYWPWDGFHVEMMADIDALIWELGGDANSPENDQATEDSKLRRYHADFERANHAFRKASRAAKQKYEKVVSPLEQALKEAEETASDEYRLSYGIARMAYDKAIAEAKKDYDGKST
jgi:hypothetical protein